MAAALGAGRPFVNRSVEYGGGRAGTNAAMQHDIKSFYINTLLPPQAA
ncbi:hypothetical protein [Rhodovulum sp. ES.010]|nr:hypothetical protein [Rhodovulum sp. ES.010]